MCLQCTGTILNTTCSIHTQAQETPQHPKHSQQHEKPLYIRPETSTTAFPTVTKEPLGAKFEFQTSKMVVCASNAPTLYSKQLVSYTSKHMKHYNTPNISKNTKTPYIRPETSKTTFPTVTKEPLGAKFEFQISKMIRMCLQCTETILKPTCIIHKQTQETPQHPKHSQKHDNPLRKTRNV